MALATRLPLLTPHGFLLLPPPPPHVAKTDLTVSAFGPQSTGEDGVGDSNGAWSLSQLVRLRAGTPSL